MKRLRRYRYVGRAELHDEIPAAEAVIVVSGAALDRWLAGRARAELDGPFTFVVALDGRLRLAPRRSEHVASGSPRAAANRSPWPPAETCSPRAR
ncbi:hypothetical protein [Micromonospora inositola]|uniref:hypothetical protein n=1 Tax=Micromonospora inositola TaxID=47865 RepID=UPI0018D559C5|nr:hypothetical protein [Micromonospora inositola]